jgi:outer membrane protein assembly factor BamE (lipoprotein component of BamABCDE complex)
VPPGLLPLPLRSTCAFALLVACLLAGCSYIAPPLQPRGDRVDADQVKQLVPGVTTQADATALLGSPTAKGTFDQSTWFYVSEMTRPVIGGTQDVAHQNVVELRFDDRGVLRHVQALDKANALPVNIVARTTPAPGTEASVLQQLFGNVGRFNPGMGTSQSDTNTTGAAQIR